jgi:hypothetical protein
MGRAVSELKRIGIPKEHHQATWKNIGEFRARNWVGAVRHPVGIHRRTIRSGWIRAILGAIWI